MIGVDTNVLIRYFVNDDESQHFLSKQFIDGTDIFISSVVLVEFFWVLKKLYKVEKDQINSIFTHIKRSSNFEIENDEVFARAVKTYSNANCDFGDAMIHALHMAKGLNTITFDKKAVTKIGMKLLG